MVDFSNFKVTEEEIIEPKIIHEKRKLREVKKEVKESKKASKNDGICPECKRRLKITGEKEMNKDQMIEWFKNYISENKENYTADWLRGIKLTFESVCEIRK